MGCIEGERMDKNNVSPINAWNREYSPAVTYSGIQLNKNVGAKYYYASNFAGDSLEFVPVDKKYYSDKYLGYKNLSEEELMINKYTFNYWHPYATDKYIAVVKDSTMTVKDGMTAFKIQTKGKEHAYGYNPSAINGDKGRSRAWLSWLERCTRFLMMERSSVTTMRLKRTNTL